MEEIEIMSWLTLDAIQKAADVTETVGDLQTGHCKSVFCEIEDDYMELCTAIPQPIISDALRTKRNSRTPLPSESKKKEMPLMRKMQGTRMKILPAKKRMKARKTLISATNQK